MISIIVIKEKLQWTQILGMALHTVCLSFGHIHINEIAGRFLIFLVFRNLNNLCYSPINLHFHAQYCIRVYFTHILVLTIDNLTRMRTYLCEGLIFNFLMDNATESLLWFYWPLDCFALRDAYEAIHQILIWTDYVRCLDSLYTLDSNPVSAQQLANNFPSSLYW